MTVPVQYRIAQDGPGGGVYARTVLLTTSLR